MKELDQQVNEIEFTLPKLEDFKKAYFKAEKEGKEVFEWGGGEWVLGYARYAIIYLDDRFGIKKIE